MTRKFWVDMIERVVMTFLQAFAGAWIVRQSFDKDTLLISLTAGAVSLAKCILAANIGNRDSASAAPTV
jgi:heme A synthase